MRVDHRVNQGVGQVVRQVRVLRCHTGIQVTHHYHRLLCAGYIHEHRAERVQRQLFLG